MAKNKYPKNSWHPRYWGTWLIIGFLTITAYLPWPVKIFFGKGLGYLAMYAAGRRRHITEVNIKLCFPEKTAKEQKKLVKECFLANGIGIFETATALVRGISFLKKRVTFKGREHLDKILAEGKGAIILGVHFSALDLGGALHGLFFTGDSIYKPHKNAVFNRFIERGRTQYFEEQIPSSDLKKLVRRVKNGKVCWYSPDQDFGRDVSVFAPFFGVEAASIVMTARIARMAKVQVLPLRIHRNPDNYTYTLEYLPPLENFPSGDDVADATQVNKVIEAMIRINPEQYLWMHRRFKTRPDPKSPSLY
ncbi:MAG TPA: LpxL/LpxP family Kdo(2)-lipid IV(A) lauroyl/palmitoleoyl acyltransferase [Marinospirillum sp.]|uniref:LpxL/LpxP family Kdo(2)-lipid IV(A) lauroyl/palmitoleoyl acyltransferase n=1 Tax=Marinospirillum sp. TaxID=2183934 RepID=UPI002B46FC44|nr:LpxL/LpxP family Kdo(2)-lipid IV(A) lauroyl/palmitoleoyl acyltransferase [Marinospirillum sp.]HKM16316.1 LpxL/LpxP family Kdo(2)-lipid IV(A) lauroyl/palmitoleoyl acyltransferase [Marinospirillum sp.]